MALGDRLPPLGAQPKGLLDVLRIANGGAYPQVLTPQLLPVMDLWEHYFATEALYVAPVNLVWVTGTNTLVQIFPGVQNWRYIVGLSLAWVPAAAADLFTGQLVIVDPSNSGQVPFPAQAPRVSTGGSSRAGSVLFPADASLPRLFDGWSGMWLPPGYALSLMQTNGINTAGGAAINASMRFVELRG